MTIFGSYLGVPLTFRLKSKGFPAIWALGTSPGGVILGHFGSFWVIFEALSSSGPVLMLSLT